MVRGNESGESYSGRTPDIGSSRPHGGIMAYHVPDLPHSDPDVVRRRARWDKDMEKSRKFPMAPLEEIYAMLLRLNMVTEETGYKFHLFPLVDVTAESLPYILQYKGTTDPDEVNRANAHRDTRALLAAMPEDVRTGKSATYRGYQIRVDRIGSLDYQMYHTTLLAEFVQDIPAEMCYMFAGDRDAHGNWSVLQQMHQDFFPTPQKE